MKGIYKIINIADGKYYVGRSVNVERRMKRHRFHLRGNYHDNSHLQNAWNKYGEDKFNFFLLEVVRCGSTKELLTIEQNYLDIAKMEQDKCYNLEFRAEGGDISEETRKKLSDRMKGGRSPFYGRKGILSPVYHNKEIAKILRMQKLGNKNPMYDDVVYDFFNQKQQETFRGTQWEFRTKYNFAAVCASHLVRGQKRSYRGWIAMKDGDPIPYVRGMVP